MEQPLVTIGAIGYNNARYVIETLESIKSQTYPNVELIVTDDCSTDKSVVGLITEWLKSYNHPYQFIIHDKNKGAPAACNEVIRRAKGKYISLIATDDILMPDKTRLQVEMLEKAGGNVGAVYSDAFIIDENSKDTNKKFIRLNKLSAPPSGRIYEHILRGNLWFHGATMLIKAECYKNVGLYEEHILSEDVDMLLRLSRTYDFMYSDYIAEKYRAHGSGLTLTNTWFVSQIQVFAKNIPYSKIAIGRMDAAAASAYATNDSKGLALLPEYKNKSAYIGLILLVVKLKMPRFIARPFLFCFRKYLQFYRALTR